MIPFLQVLYYFSKVIEKKIYVILFENVMFRFYTALATNEHRSILR